MDNEKSQIGINIVIGVLALVVVIVAAVAMAKWSDKQEITSNDVPSTTQVSTDNVEKWQEGDISYNGELYRYNSGIKTYLFMGVDKSGEVAEGEDGIDGGQSDAMFLFVTDSKKETISVISINRNTMTLVDVYDRAGFFVGQAELQICLQHGYGDGMRSSCLRTVEAVSRLFDDIPISGYLSLNMDAIPTLNDALGGVTVEVMDDLENAELGVSLKKGEIVTLNGNEAFAYIRSRDLNEFDSATRRLERQNQYLLQMVSQVRHVASQGESAIMEMYNKIDDYMVTSIDFVRLAEDAMEYQFDSSRLYTIPGETVEGKQFEEHYIDETALYEIILEVFYEKVEN